MELRKATSGDAGMIWEILQQAIERRRLDGSQQWQDGYPNPATVQNDIEKGWGYVLLSDDEIAAYGALIPDYEPAYDAIQGQWLTHGRFLVIHRVAVTNKVTGKGFATAFFKEAEAVAKARNINSIKVDTNFDNAPMLHILKKLGYTYCGEVFFRGAARKAFEKVLSHETPM